MWYSEHGAKSICYDNCYKIKQATCTFQFACKHTVLKHAIFPELGYTNSKSDLQPHSKSLAIVPFDEPYIVSYISLLL